MVQNRTKLIDLFIGNLSNSIIHKILESAINNKEIADRYQKELIIRISKGYIGINLDLIEEIINDYLKELKVT